MTTTCRLCVSATVEWFVIAASSRAERQPHLVLDLAQRHDGARLPDARQVEQEPVQEPVVGFGAFYQDLQPEVGIARHRVALEDLGCVAHRALEGLDRAGRRRPAAALRDNAERQSVVWGRGLS